MRVEIVAVAGPRIFAGCSSETRLDGVQVDVAAEHSRVRFKLDEDRSEPALEQRADALMALVEERDVARLEGVHAD